MSFLKRLGNVVRGRIALESRGSQPGLSDAALDAELARPVPSESAREELRARKTGAANPDTHTPGPAAAGTDDQTAKLRALAERFRAGELDQAAYDRLRAEVIHGPGHAPERKL